MFARKLFTLFMGPRNPDLKAAVQGLGYTSVGTPGSISS
jgi:hypothetical protein